jgi:hypothetical protein
MMGGDMFERFIREVTERQQPLLSAEYGPPGEVETLAHIQNLCWLAGMSAQNIAEDDGNPPTTGDVPQYEPQRYEKLRLQAVRLVDGLTDNFYRSTAIHFLIDLCMKADDVELAGVWFKQVKVDRIREKIVAAYPQLVASEV